MGNQDHLTIAAADLEGTDHTIGAVLAGVQVFHQPAAHTDSDSIVFFRYSDVISAGDILSTTSYPVIDLDKGGTAIPYWMEDPYLRKEFEETLRVNGVECRMDPKWYVAPNQVSEKRDTVV